MESISVSVLSSLLLSHIMTCFFSCSSPPFQSLNKQIRSSFPLLPELNPTDLSSAFRLNPVIFVPQMSSFSTRALTLLSSVFGACGLLLVGVAVSTDYWLLMEEGIILQQNQTTEVKMALHSGLWRVCFVAGW